MVFDLVAKRVTQHFEVGSSPDVLAEDEANHRIYVAADFVEGGCRAWAQRSRSRFVLTERGLPGFRAPTLRPDRPVSYGPDCFFEYGMV